MFLALELVENRETRTGFNQGPGMVRELQRAAMDVGLICYPGGITVDGLFVPHILLAPPLIAEEHHLQDCVDRLSATLSRVTGD